MVSRKNCSTHLAAHVPRTPHLHPGAHLSSLAGPGGCSSSNQSLLLPTYPIPAHSSPPTLIVSGPPGLESEEDILALLVSPDSVRLDPGLCVSVSPLGPPSPVGPSVETGQ